MHRERHAMEMPGCAAVVVAKRYRGCRVFESLRDGAAARSLRNRPHAVGKIHRDGAAQLPPRITDCVRRVCCDPIVEPPVDPRTAAGMERLA